MYVGSVRRKKINLWLLILIILFIIAIIFTIIHIFNSSQASSDDRASQNHSLIASNNINKKTDGSGIGKISSYSDFYDIESNSSQESDSEITLPISENFEDIPTQENLSTETSLKLNNHTYVFDKDKQATLVDNKYVQICNNTYLMRLTTSNYNYLDLKNKSSLKSFLQDTYNMTITSDLKTGNMKNTDLLLCTISENNDVAYFFITPLNSSEVLCLKVYNSEDMSTLIKDISEPIGEISSIKTSIQ